jgi:hypothetical protein
VEAPRTCDTRNFDALESWAPSHGEWSHGKRPKEEIRNVIPFQSSGVWESGLTHSKNPDMRNCDVPFA